MNKWIKISVLVVVAITFSGCPAAVAVQAGLWLVENSLSPNDVYAVLFLESGLALAQDPNLLPDGVIATGTLGGTIRWMQDGSQFSMHQDNTSAVFDYTATVESSTQLSGTLQQTGLGGNFAGTFTAMRVAI